MKISRTFVKWFLGLIFLVIIANIIGITLGFYKAWMAYTTLGFFIVLFFLIFRKHKAGFIRFLAWTLPILFILGVLYFNFMPFGFHNTYTLTIGEDGKVTSSSSQIHLEDLKGKVITSLSDVYNYTQVNVVVKPKAVLRNAIVNISIVNSNQSNVYLAKTNFDVSENKWDYLWNFTKGVPSSLNGTAKYNKDLGCIYFNSSKNETLNYPNSSNMFENGSFVAYAKWNPQDAFGKAQQIIGHFNWELWQNNNSVSLMIGRLDNKTGSMPSISYIINQTTFFNQVHNALAIYKADKNNSKGYMELWVDGTFAGRKTIANQTIWQDYGSNELSFGWSPHNYGNNSYYAGCIYQAGFDYSTINYLAKDSFTSSNKTIQIPLLGSGKPQEIELIVKQAGIFN